MLKHLFRWVVYGNFWVSACALAMYLCSAALIDLKLNLYVALCVFFGTLAVYNFHRIYRLTALYYAEKSVRHEWIVKQHKYLWFFTIIAVLICAFCAYFLFSFELLLTATPAIFVVILYVLPVFKLAGKKVRLRDIPFLKLFLVAFSWAYVTVVFPIVIARNDLLFLSELDFWLGFMQRLVFIFAITIPFDFRDAAIDLKNGVSTFANSFGVQRAKSWALGLLLFFVCLVMTSFLLGYYDLVEMNALVISAIFTGFLVNAANEHQPEWFFSFLIDGTMIDQLFWLALFSFVFV